MAAQLRRRLGNLFEAMPRDLQQTMLSAPRRASMLQSLRVQSKVAVPGMPIPVRLVPCACAASVLATGSGMMCCEWITGRNSCSASERITSSAA